MGLLYCSTVATSLRTFPIHCFGVFSFVLRHWCNELLIALSHFAVSYVLIALYHIFRTSFLTDMEPGRKQKTTTVARPGDAFVFHRRKEQWTKQQWLLQQKQLLQTRRQQLRRCERASSTQKGHYRPVQISQLVLPVPQKCHNWKRPDLAALTKIKRLHIM